MKKILFAAVLSAPLLASAAPNVLVNGSFENGLAGWTSTTSPGTTYPVAVITYGTTGSTFGEAIPPDNSSSMSPDPVGTKAVYFVEDNATQTLSQTFTLASGGQYAVGFSSFVPANGAGNRYDALFSATLDSTPLLATSVGSLPVRTWQAQSAQLLLTPGVHTVNFSFATTGGSSKDLVIDRAFVTAVSAVPEPETYAMLMAGLAAIGFVARRRKQR